MHTIHFLRAFMHQRLLVRALRARMKSSRRVVNDCRNSRNRAAELATRVAGNSPHSPV